MSVLDRAIVKAFERHSRSAATEKQVVVEVPTSAQTARPEALPTPASPQPPAALEDTSAVAVEKVPFNTALPNTDDRPTPLQSSATSEIQNLGTVTASPRSTSHDSPEFSNREVTRQMESAVAPLERVEQDVNSAVQAAIQSAPPATHSVTQTHPVPAPPAEARSLAPELPSARSLPAQDDAPSVVTPAPKIPGTGPPPAQPWKWPEICEQLDQFTGEGFQQLAKHLQFAAEQGHKVLAFVSSQRDAGRTSVLLTLTRILALEGKSSVLLIDADHRHPHIAELSGLQPQCGFEDVLKGSHRVQQATVPMSPGRVSLLPLTRELTNGDWLKTVTSFRVLLHQARREYDMILIDAGVFGEETPLTECWLRGISDAVVTVSRQLTVQNAEHVVLDWKKIGIESLGVIETFA